MISPFLVWSIGTMATLLQRLVWPWWHQPPIIAKSVVSAIVLPALLLLPLAHCVKLQNDPYRPRWREAYAFLAERVQTADALIVSVPFAELYYLGKPSTHVMNNLRLNVRNREPKQNADGSLADWYSGLPLLTSLPEFQQVRTAYLRGWIVVDRGRFFSPQATPPELQEYIRQHCRVYPAVRDGTVFVFGWNDTTGTSALMEPGVRLQSAPASERTPPLVSPLARPTHTVKVGQSFCREEPDDTPCRSVTYLPSRRR